jgi:hypothetical protein
VVTMVAIVVAYHVNWIRQRHAFLDQPHVSSVSSKSLSTTTNRRGNANSVDAPRGLWLFGERGVESVWIWYDVWSPEKCAQAAELFPEAGIGKMVVPGLNPFLSAAGGSRATWFRADKSTTLKRYRSQYVGR